MVYNIIYYFVKIKKKVKRICIGSEGYEAVRMGRRAILIELKKSYYDLSVKYMKQAEQLSKSEGFGL